MPHTPRPSRPDPATEAARTPATALLGALVARPAARALRRGPWAAPAGTPGPGPAATDRPAETLLRRALPRARTAHRLAELALGAGRLDEADRLLDLVPAGTPGRAGTAARRQHHVGRISEAVVGLRRAATTGRATPQERRQLHRYEDELRLLSGWRPGLTPVVGYRPGPAAVLHVLPASPAGPRGRRTPRQHAQLSATAAQGWAVTAVTRPGRGTRSRAAEDARSVDGIAYHRIPPARGPLTATARLQREAQALLELALRTRPAVLHTTGHAGNALITRAVADALGVPWVYEVRQLPADRWAASRPAEAVTSERYRLSCAREAELLAAADDVVVPSRAMHERVRELTGALATGPVPVRVAPPAVSGPYLADPRPPQEARRVLGLPESGRIVGAVADLLEREGLDDLLRAAALVAADVPELLVVLVGEGPARPRLEALAAQLGLGARVRFAGRVPDDQMVLHHQAFDVYVVPRRDAAGTRAAVPTASVEALATGTPVVASRLPVLAETVSDGITGLLTPPGEPQTLATVLQMLLESPAVRRCLGQEARRRAVPARSPHAAAAVAAGAYDALTGRGAAQEATA